MPEPNLFQTGSAFYSAPIQEFLSSSDDAIWANLVLNNQFSLEITQRDAWQEQVLILRKTLNELGGLGWLALEFVVPRIGKRIDALVIIRNIIFVLEFKVGKSVSTNSDREQVWDYALDLKNFHSTSHHAVIAPVLIATHSKVSTGTYFKSAISDGVLTPVDANSQGLIHVMESVLADNPGPDIDIPSWLEGRYQPTPTIIDAAKALYGNHSVLDISRSDASAKNLTETSEAIDQIIHKSRELSQKSICFVTGVPGAGKTLVGLNVATQHSDSESGLHSVYLSGNGPLVTILREALARDRVEAVKAKGVKTTLKLARQPVQAFIQNVHHFRDAYLKDQKAPSDHVTIFDEAQRAWNVEQAASFMKRKRNLPNFSMSEPEFLISCMDRHADWAVVVCLIGGGQEIHTGEAGIGEWIRAVKRSYPDWHVHISPHLYDSEYQAGDALQLLDDYPQRHQNDSLHLSVSMRSFRTERLSHLIKAILDLEIDEARSIYESLKDKYPIVLTRDVNAAKDWIRAQARGSERYGMMVSSQAQRLKPLAIDVRPQINPIHWFLSPKEDVRSSYYLEDVGTEFHVQGLELDWTCVVWDGDFRRSKDGWEHWSFKGDKWQRVKKEERQAYLKNAYRVLLTRARQGMVIVVPEGNKDDATRAPGYYLETYTYLQSLGFQVI